MTYATVRRAVSELSVSIYSQSTASERRTRGSTTLNGLKPDIFH